MKTVAHCVAKGFTSLRNQGISPEKTTCVGHSLGSNLKFKLTILKFYYKNQFYYILFTHTLCVGSHICGLMANYLNFRLERIIALDPARKYTIFILLPNTYCVRTVIHFIFYFRTTH